MDATGVETDESVYFYMEKAEEKMAYNMHGVLRKSQFCVRSRMINDKYISLERGNVHMTDYAHYLPIFIKIVSIGY